MRLMDGVVDTEGLVWKCSVYFQMMVVVVGLGVDSLFELLILIQESEKLLHIRGGEDEGHLLSLLVFVSSWVS